MPVRSGTISGLAYQWGKWAITRFQTRADVYVHFAVAAGFVALSAVLLWPITGSDYPPGVDTPTFLHLSWVAELAISGELENALEDPYWYGGFFYPVYPPLSYGLVGAISAVTNAGFVDVYNALLFISYGLVGYAVWFLAREFGLRGWSAILAGRLTVLAYPLLGSVFLWGWFTPFGWFVDSSRGLRTQKSLKRYFGKEPAG